MRGVTRRRGVLRQPADEPEAREARDTRGARNREQHERSTDPARRNHGQSGPQRHVVRQRRGHRRERCQRDCVNESEQDERETECADARPTAGTARDGNPDDVVEPARQRNARHRRGSAGGRKRGRPRTLVTVEEASPPVRFQAVRREEKQAGSGGKQGIGARERHPGFDDVPNGERKRGERDDAEGDVQTEPDVWTAPSSQRPLRHR